MEISGRRPRKVTLAILALIALAGCAQAPGAALGPPPATQALPPLPSPSVPARTDPPPTATERPRPTAPAPSPSPTAAATATPAPSPAGTPAPTLEGDLVARTERLDIYRLNGSVPITAVLDLAPQIERAIDRVGARMGARLSGRVALRFEPPQQGPCAIRGLTLSHQRTIRMFYGPTTTPARLLPIAAHELAHQLQHDYYGWAAHQRSDTILLEGQATWASGDYAIGADGRPEWASRAEQALDAGELLRLDADLEADCHTTTRGAAYTGWAAFVAFLMTQGRERFDALYRSGGGHTPGSADYDGVYGKSLAELDQEWRAWLTVQRAAGSSRQPRRRTGSLSAAAVGSRRSNVQTFKRSAFSAWQSAVGSRQSAVGSRQSAFQRSNVPTFKRSAFSVQRSALGSRQSAFKRSNVQTFSVQRSTLGSRRSALGTELDVCAERAAHCVVQDPDAPTSSRSVRQVRCRMGERSIDRPCARRPAAADFRQARPTSSAL
ncbi:MAG: hypothetical protein IPO81_07280 [Kouleothrix sp.]|nr:hypothetical protein [Kouleothrix sp.]